MGDTHSVGMVKKLRALKICPVTGGRPTTMTMEGFMAACERCQEQNRSGWGQQQNYKNTWCDTCQGKHLPKELQVLQLAQMKKERAKVQYMKSREMRKHSPAR